MIRLQAILCYTYYTYPRVRRYLLLRFQSTIFSKYGTGEKTGTKLIRRMTVTETKRPRQIRNLTDVLCYKHTEERTKPSVRQKESFRKGNRGRKLGGSWLSRVQVATGFQSTLIDRKKYLTLERILWKLISRAVYAVAASRFGSILS